MQQDKAEMQGTQQFPSLWRIPIHTDRENLHKISTEIIDRYLGVPYQVMGRSMEGTDCYGLILMIYKDLGYNLFDISENYNDEWSSEGKNFFYENYYKEWDIVEKPEPFDVVLFHNGMGIVNHGGVILTQGKLIQAGQAGTTVVRIDSENLKKKIEGFYTLRALRRLREQNHDNN